MYVARPLLVLLGISGMVLVALTGCHVGAIDPLDPDEIGPPPPNVEQQLGCAGNCHGNETSIAPPADTQGQTDPSLRSVGAHRSHLNPAPVWHRKILCSDCHVVPTAVADPGHIDTPLPAELTFGEVARADGSNPVWNGTTCSNVYCHGSTLAGGALTTPTWTQLDGSQKACGTCHGYPPPAPHPNNVDCGSCHPTVQPGATTFLDPESHINGRLEVALNNNQGCDSCHGGGGVAAPPRDLAGNLASPQVGAHRAHLGPSPWRRELYCSQCHVVPVNINDPGHIDGDNQAEVTFDPLNPQGAYAAPTNTCSNLYCHGNGWNQLGTMVWNQPQNLGCNSCHRTDGQGMSGRHRKHLDDEDLTCYDCHRDVVNAQRTIIAPDLHINGVHEVRMAQGAYDPTTRFCSNVGCHNNKRW